MTIQGTFRLDSETIQVIIDGNNLMFFDIATGIITSLEGLQLDKQGTIKEFPDLKDNENWRKIAIERLKEHIKKFETEKQKLDYVKEELERYGWKGLYFQRAGFRPTKWE